ncbi:universal stress protein [Flavobacteriaceae bacterium S0825]|uniref:universal stress protein n=1 Tax=Gaetbulibacter sp. S0825 TaxID=2720084 RepID=UPI00142FFBCB|nr:universal stress protein [Gaetbulibacter sp. S0825]MCK0109444.1 universal stress protein [Flavobacteriaceae bacterium S0825]NIX65079.1 universal stress protein [Gaetbulibacter sp. S0825]
MKSILLPTDFSKNSWNAIKYALQFFKKSNCHFYLLHVNRLSNLASVDTSYITTPEAIEEVQTKLAKKKLRDFLKRISKELPHNKNHKFYTITDYNFFIESIRNHVQEKSIDMIVMGTKGSSGLKKFIIGSNTGDVITKVSCTTLVVPENAKYTSIKEIAFPTDLALSYHIQTLEPISEILDEFDSFLRILHINKKKEILNRDQQKYKELLEDYFNGYKHSFHFLTNDKIEDAVQCFVESRDIDMIAMVAKNLNYFQRILFMPTVEEISYHTDVPFLVLHEQQN